MPIPFVLIGAAAVAGVTGAVSTGVSIFNNKDAKRIIEDAQHLYDVAKEKLDAQRLITSQDLDNLGIVKLNSWSNDIGGFLEYFQLFKNVQISNMLNPNEQIKQYITPNNINEMKLASMNASEIIKGGTAALGAGALAGVATYGGAMMFAHASTGTAIATLSGAAAKNATLAWFGGGAIKAGGLGIAGGSWVLGGVVVGPVLAVSGIILAAKSKSNLAKAKKTYSDAELAAEQMATIEDFMKNVSVISEDYRELIINFSQKYNTLILDNIKGLYAKTEQEQGKSLLNRIKKFLGIKIKIDFKKMEERDQKSLQYFWLTTQVLYKLLSSSILSESGEIDENATKTLEQAKYESMQYLGISGE